MPSLTAFDRLAPFVRDFVYRQEWEVLRPLQVNTIFTILDGEEDVLIATETASGKTEAALFPILTRISADPETSVRVLYIAPLKALINDQFKRLEQICEAGDIPIHKWHGDVSATHKAHLIDHPGGVLQITPESLESLFINRTRHLASLFCCLSYVIIDEVHYFLESDRGIQLRIQLERLNHYCITGRPRRIGLSATIGDLEVAKTWLNPRSPNQVRVINNKTPRQRTFLAHNHVQNEELIPPDLFNLTRTGKSLIFCNRRDQVEVFTNTLNRLCARNLADERYLPHHGSISKDVREEAEERMRENPSPAAVVCTNTLELGIDVGSLDLVVQVDSTNSVSSFTQRIGRTGRREGAPRVMQVYTVGNEAEGNAPFYKKLDFALLKALAVESLFFENKLEPVAIRGKSYNVLFHQILSYLTETGGCQPANLVQFFIDTNIFPDVSANDYIDLLKFMRKNDHIEQLENHELIVGLEGEKIVRSREFYAVFQTPPDLVVQHGSYTVGRVAPPVTPELVMLLAGKAWRVIEVLEKEKTVYVEPAGSSRATLFPVTEGPDMHPMIAEQAREILTSLEYPAYLNELGRESLFESREAAMLTGIDHKTLFHMGKEGYAFFPWSGHRAVRALCQILPFIGFRTATDPELFPWVILIKNDFDIEGIKAKFNLLISGETTKEEVCLSIPLITHKFDEFLPESLLLSRNITEWIDWEVGLRLAAEALAEMESPHICT